MGITLIENIDKEIIQSSKNNILIVGSREQGKTDIMLKKLMWNLSKNKITPNEVLFFVEDTKQVLKLEKKIQSIYPMYINKIKIIRYATFFNELYLLLQLPEETPSNLVNSNIWQNKYADQIMKLMEIVYNQLDMSFGKYPFHTLWKQYVNYTYNLENKKLILKGKYNDKKIFSFFIKFHQIMLNKNLQTIHGMLNKIVFYLQNVSRTNKLNTFFSNIKQIYCDDTHFLTKKEWQVLICFINMKKIKYILACDIYYLPERLLDIEDNKVAIDYLLQQLPIEIIRWNKETNLTKSQKIVYSLLTNAITPIVPISKKTKEINFSVTNEFEILVTPFKLNIIKNIFELITTTYILNNKKVAIFQDNDETTPLLEAFLMSFGLPFYKKTNNNFWINPHNSFLSCYVSFLNRSYEVHDISYFFANIIPNYNEFEAQAMNYLQDVLEKGFKVNIYNYVNITNPSEAMFCKIIKDLSSLSHSLKNDFHYYKKIIFDNKWVKLYENIKKSESFASYSYISILQQMLSIINFESLSHFCAFLNALEDREFYNKKEGVLICDRDLFDYTIYDYIIIFTKSSNVGTTLETQTHKTHSLLYQVASSFREKLYLFVENEKNTNIEDILGDKLRFYKE